LSGLSRAKPHEDCLKRERTLKRTSFKVKAKPGQWSTFSKPSKGFQRKAVDPAARDEKPVKRRKVSRPKKATGQDAKYLAACRGEACYLRVPDICLRSPETVVPCHSNQSRHGKGMGIKAGDRYTVPGCMACHAYIDQGKAVRDEKFRIWDVAFGIWETVRDLKFGLEVMK